MNSWAVDPTPYNLDCHSHSCKYAVDKSGMRNNGRCRCASDRPQEVERFLRDNYLHVKAQMDLLKKRFGVD